MAKKHSLPNLHVVAVPHSSVREVEPNGSVLPNIRFVGKVHNPATNEHEVVPEGVEVPYSAHIVQQLKHGALLAASSETAHAAGVSLLGAK